VERSLSSETTFDGRFLTVRVDEVENEDGHRSTREVVATRGAAAVVCVHGSDLVLVRQYRYPVARTLLEHLVSYFAAPGFTNHAMEIFFTDEVEETESDPDDGEMLEIVRRPLATIGDLITNGEVSDAKTLIGLALIALRGDTGSR
jgi:ADP-ribose pyrophosphatase